jgi:hypothetical protein
MKKLPQKIQSLLDSKDGEVIKFDLGCGQDKQPGFISIDSRSLPGVDIVHNLEKYPYPLLDKTATLIKAGHIVEKINPVNQGFIRFMNEMWRILKYDGQLLISSYYAGSAGYWSDPCNINGCTQHTWFYFDPLNPAGLYSKYEPAPWKVDKSYANVDGIMEVLLTKRRDDISYHIDKKLKYDQHGNSK